MHFAIWTNTFSNLDKWSLAKYPALDKQGFAKKIVTFEKYFHVLIQIWRYFLLKLFTFTYIRNLTIMFMQKLPVCVFLVAFINGFKKKFLQLICARFSKHIWWCTILDIWESGTDMSKTVHHHICFYISLFFSSRSIHALYILYTLCPIHLGRV